MTAVAAVAEICAGIQKAYASMRLYPSGHSMIETRMQPLTSALHAFLSEHGSLPLDVEESRLTYSGEPVFRQDSMRDDMAFILFREGVRRLTIYAGLEERELRDLVDRFSRATETMAQDQDLVTLLWEAGFAHIDYELVDPLQLEPTTVNSFEELKANTRARILDSERADLSLTTAGWSDSDHALPRPGIEQGVLVGPEELAVLEKALEQEARPLEQFVEVLSEVIACSATQQGAENARRMLSRVLVAELQQGDLALVLSTVRRLQDVRSQRPDRAAECDAVLVDLATVGALRNVLFGLDGVLQNRRSDLEALLLALAPHSYPALLDLLAEAQGQRARKCILHLLGTDKRLPLTLLRDRLSHPDWFVVRNLVVLLAAARDRCPAEYLLAPLNHADERVRREVVRALENLTDAQASPLLLSALSDPSSSVRTAAARALGRRREAAALPELLEVVESRIFAGREPVEVEAFLEAAAALSDDSALPSLSRLWKDRLVRARSSHVRVGAIRVLAAIGTPAARAELEKARRSRNRNVRQEAERCLLRLENGPVSESERAG